jgi:hypothetical protein
MVSRLLSGYPGISQEPSMKTLIIVLILGYVSPQLGLASDNEGKYRTHGIGTDLCSEYYALSNALYEEWMMGYVTAFNHLTFPFDDLSLYSCDIPLSTP